MTDEKEPDELSKANGIFLLLGLALVVAVAIFSVVMFIASLSKAEARGRGYQKPSVSRCFKSCDRQYNEGTYGHRVCVRGCYKRGLRDGGFDRGCSYDRYGNDECGANDRRRRRYRRYNFIDVVSPTIKVADYYNPRTGKRIHKRSRSKRDYHHSTRRSIRNYYKKRGRSKSPYRKRYRPYRRSYDPRY